MLSERRAPRQVVSSALTRREVLALAAAGALAACAPAQTTGRTLTPTPKASLLAPRRPIALAAASSVGALGVLDANDYRLRGVAWSPDSSRVAAGGGKNVHVWDAATGQVTGTWTGHTDQIFGMAWSPAANLLASASGDGSVRLWNGADGTSVRVLRGPSLTPLSVAWSPAGDTLAVGNVDGTVALVQPQTGAVTATLSGPPMQGARGQNPYAVYGLAWAPDGKRLASTRYDRYVLIWDASSAKALATLPVTSQPNSVAWSPDGRSFSSSHDDGTVHVWDGATYAEHATLNDDSVVGGWAFPMAWSPDGQLLAAARETGLIQLWDVPSASPAGSLTGHSAGVWAMSLSPDATRLASASDDTTLRLWGVR